MRLLKYLALLIFAVSLSFSFIGQPQRGWIPPYEDYKQFIDRHPLSSSIACVSFVILIFTIWYERRQKTVQQCDQANRSPTRT
jgi:hypothetical protein